MRFRSSISVGKVAETVGSFKIRVHRLRGRVDLSTRDAILCARRNGKGRSAIMTITRHDDAWFEETSAIMAEAAKDELSPETIRAQVVSMAVSAATGDNDEAPANRAELEAHAKRMGVIP